MSDESSSSLRFDSSETSTKDLHDPSLSSCCSSPHSKDEKSPLSSPSSSSSCCSKGVLRIREDDTDDLLCPETISSRRIIRVNPTRSLADGRPVIAQPNLVMRRLQYGETYQWCSCGLSEQQPWCDGKGCAGSSFQPVEFVANKDQTYYALCNCKYTGTPPYCDGSHIHLQW